MFAIFYLMLTFVGVHQRLNDKKYNGFYCMKLFKCQADVPRVLGALCTAGHATDQGEGKIP